jgi:hypothetical protein
MAMADEEKLKTGKGAVFVKGQLKRLPQGDETWEADFQALPKPIEQTQTHYLGMVVTEKDGSLLADTTVHGRPSVNDLATILAHAMRRPLDGDARRPKLVRLRGHHQWRGLFPHLEEIGVEVEVCVGRDLPGIMAAYGEHLRQMREARRVGMIEPSSVQANVELLFPAIARWVEEYGWIEIGVQELFGFVARALHEGGTQVEDNRPDSLAEVLAAIEVGLARWFEEQGVELD